jgi:hypothetical protein
MLIVALAAAALLSLLAAPSVEAHLHSGTVAVDYRATLLNHDSSAYTARIFQSDRALELSVERGHVVVLLGYLGEPVFRLTWAGLSVNTASPTAVVVRLVGRSQQAPGARPRWRLYRGRRSVIWQDARAQGLQPGVREGIWSVPLIVDGRRGPLEGELRRFQAPALSPWLALAACLLAIGAAPLVMRRREVAGPAALAGAAVRSSLASAVACLVILLGFTLDAYASPGTWLEAFNALVFLGVGIWIALRGPGELRGAGTVGTGLVGMAVGLLAVPIFFHPIVLAVLPAGVMRFAAVAAIAAGLVAAGLGCASYLESAALGDSADPRVVSGQLR